MADFRDLDERSSVDLQSSDEVVVQPDGDVSPERSSLQALTTYVGDNFSFSYEGRENIVRAYEDQTGTTSTGVTSLVLPTDYTDYQHLEVIAMSPGNVTTTVRVETALLDIQTATGTNLFKMGVSDLAESGNRMWLTWTQSTRTIGRGGQNGSDIRIVSAKLYDIGDSADSSGSSSGSGFDDSQLTQIDALAGIAIASHNADAGAHADIRSLMATEFADVDSRLVNLGDVQSVTISSASSYQSTLNSQEGSAKPLILVIDTAINGIRSGERYTYPAGQVAYIPPTSDVLEPLFVLPAGGTIADNSITPAKAQADTAARQKAWRERFGSAHIGAGLTLPAASDSNEGDVRIFTQDVASGLSWRDISDTTTTITSADSGDVALYLGTRLGWTRVGNIFRSAGAGGGLTQAQVDARVTAGIATLESQVWPGEAVVSPHELYSEYGAFTMRATISRVSGTFPNGARMRIVAGGRTGTFVHAVDDINTPAILAFTEAQSRALIQVTTNGFIGGSPYLDVYASDETTRIARLPIRIRVIPRGGWRILTGSSPYTVRTEDTEFMVEIREKNTIRYYLQEVPRLLLSTASRRYMVGENNFGGANLLGVDVSISGNSLTAVLFKDGSDTNNSAVTRVIAR